jgi:hypothetical protein
MGSLLIICVAAAGLYAMAAALSKRQWVERVPCAAIGIWLGAVMMTPLSAIASIALLWADPHTGAGSSALPSYIAAAGSAVLLVASWRVGRRFVEVNRDARRRRRRHEMLIDLFASGRPDLGDVHVIQDSHRPSLTTWTGLRSKPSSPTNERTSADAIT